MDLSTEELHTLGFALMKAVWAQKETIEQCKKRASDPEWAMKPHVEEMEKYNALQERIKLELLRRRPHA